MNTEQEVGQMRGESNAKSPGAARDPTAVEDTHSSTLDLVASITETGLGSTGKEMLEEHVKGGSPSSSITSGEVHGTAPPPSDSHSTIGGATTSPKSALTLSSISGEAVHAAEASTGNPTAFVGEIANTAGIASTEDIKDKAQALVVTRLRAIVLVYAAKLPIVGSYFVDTKRVGDPNGDTTATETTPLLGALRDPKAFATKQAEGLLFRLFSPLLSRIPDIDALDNEDPAKHGPLFKVLVECYALTRNGGGWLFTHLQEHSLVIAPTVSLGHLSTTDLAASTIGTAVTSITGYSIIQGFISSLDKVLADAPNHRTARIACAQAAFVTGIALFPITNLWTVYSGTLLQRLGQKPEVSTPASGFLRVAAAGLPGYAISELAKRYLTSQGLSSVHTRVLSAIAPVNLVLNYLLVDGPIPALRLGFAGAPLCTAISHNALAIILIVYIVQRTIREEVESLREQNIVPDEPLLANGNSARPTGSEGPQDHSDPTFFAGFRALVLAGISGISKSASQLWSKDFGGAVASILGPDALATQAILLTTATTLYQAPKAMSNASSDRIKKWIAKGDVQRAKMAACVAFFSTLGGVFIISNVLLAFAASWGKLFNNDPTVLENVTALLPIIAIFQAVHGIGAWADGSLGALGKTAVFPSLNASADYLLGSCFRWWACQKADRLTGIPLGVYLSLVRGWGLSGLWVGLTISLAYSCLVAVVVLVRTNWTRVVCLRGVSTRGDLTHDRTEGY